MSASGTASDSSSGFGGGLPLALRVRGFKDSDRDSVLEMYPRGLINQGAEETPAFIAGLIDQDSPGSVKIWVAEANGLIVACLVVARIGPEVAHLRGLSVLPGVEGRDGVIRRLVDTAVMHAWDEGYLKLVVHTSRSGEELEPHFHRVSFEFSKESWVDGRHW